MKLYIDDDLLMLSGIQHIAFCERQWALIHIEQQWVENIFTVEGHHLHEKVDNPFESEIMPNSMILRSVPLVSYKLGLYGYADVVELKKTHDSANSIVIKGKDGRWNMMPVEYKRGKPKKDRCDDVQLCAQAMCLEEMYGINIFNGSFYYGEIRHRHNIEFNDDLRGQVVYYAQRMHELFEKGITPLPLFKKQCHSCSLNDLCMPESLSGANKVSEYLKKLIES